MPATPARVRPPQPAYAHLRLGVGAFAVAEAPAPQVLCLPIYPGMIDAQVERVVAEIRVFAGGGSCADRSVVDGPAKLDGP